MSRVWILGSKGRLGAALTRQWGANHDVQGFSRHQVDVSDPGALECLLGKGGFDILVNCTGWTSLEACEDDPLTARRINSEAPGQMARLAARCGARLIHFSTDYVFDGGTPGLRTEDEVPSPLSVYGRSKLDGERPVLESSDRHVVFRVSWVFGPDKPSFVDMILQRAIQSDHVEAVVNKISTPTYTLDAARWFEPWLEEDRPGGLWHACNTGHCSWQEYGQHALDAAAAQGWPLRVREVAPVALEDMTCFRAIRPVHTALSNKRLAAAVGLIPRPWQEAVGAYVSGLPVPAV